MRYARAKGSKASNEKLPEDATPWQVMKKQMFDAQQPKVQPIENVNDFLKKDSGNEGTTWAEFEETKPKKHAAVKKQRKAEAKSVVQKKKQKIKQNDTFENDKSVGEVDAESTVALPKKIKKEKTKPNPTKVEEFSENQKPDSQGSELDLPVHVFGTKPMKGNQFGKKENFVRKGNKGNFRGKGRFEPYNQEQMQDHPIERRKAFKDTFTIKVGHSVVELRYYDRFPVKVEDWERLTELERKLREENIPEEQIAATMKLQRRRAEKALTRERKKVCFHCREPGHVLSDCPLIGEAPIGKNKDSTMPDSHTTGMCYRCGSLEHTHYECKVVKEDSYKFAKCFVCGDQGHISRQCPDNPRGLYPKGGGCSECGDVTHFKKDCPKYQKEKQESALTVPTLKQDDVLEALDGDSEQVTQQTPNTLKKYKKKVVKF